MMEPYRPLVDQIVLKLADEPSLSPESKAELAQLIHIQIKTPKGRRPLYLALQEVASQLTEIYNTAVEGKNKD